MFLCAKVLEFSRYSSLIVKKYFIDLGIIEEYTKTQEEKERDRMQGLGRLLVFM